MLPRLPPRVALLCFAFFGVSEFEASVRFRFEASTKSQSRLVVSCLYGDSDPTLRRGSTWKMTWWRSLLRK